MIELVLGGARSGKSAYAQTQAQAKRKQVTFIATAEVLDDEMASRIARHKADRPKHWDLFEQAVNISNVIRTESSDYNHLLIIDCLTLWLNNELYQKPTVTFDELADPLLDALDRANSDIILVSNEVGMGIVPMGELTRQFIDWQGWLNQKIATLADKVTFVAAGLPLSLKDLTRGK